MLRTHTCGELTLAAKDSEVTLCGWVDSQRDHGGTLFIDLRDRYGKTQVVFGSEADDAAKTLARSLRSEDVVKVVGKVAPRPEGTLNPKLKTGEIEVRTLTLEVLNKSKTPPFTPGQVDLPGEDLRLKHRYLDLRRPPMQKMLMLRDRITKEMRDYLAEQDFIDVETPILGRSTPEAHATTWFLVEFTRVRFTRCLNRHSCTSKS